jgi:hypothetical protein
MPSRQDDSRDDPVNSGSAHATSGSGIELTPLHALNRAGLGALVEAARIPEGEPMPGFLAELRDQLEALGEEAQFRAAECPFLLLNVGFQDEEWWRGLKYGLPRNAREPVACFPRLKAMPLARSTLTLAWHWAHADPETAGLVLGISRTCAALIASLTLQELETIAHRQHRCLRPRWEDRPAVWRALLGAAQQADREALSDFRLYGIRLVIGELLQLPHAG